MLNEFVEAWQSETAEYMCEKKTWDVIDRINQQLKHFNHNDIDNANLLAAIMNIPLYAANNILSANCNFNLLLISNIAKCLNTTTDWLLGVDSEEEVLAALKEKGYKVIKTEKIPTLDPCICGCNRRNLCSTTLKGGFFGYQYQCKKCGRYGYVGKSKAKAKEAWNRRISEEHQGPTLFDDQK